VNPGNNVAKLYTVVDVAAIMERAREWRKVFEV